MSNSKKKGAGTLSFLIHHVHDLHIYFAFLLVLEESGISLYTQDVFLDNLKKKSPVVFISDTNLISYQQIYIFF